MTPVHSPIQVEVAICVPDDQTRYAPRRPLAPKFLPPNAPLPRKGEVIYMASESPWVVSLVIHQWRNPWFVRVEVWIEFMGNGRFGRPSGFSLTQ